MATTAPGGQSISMPFARQALKAVYRSLPLKKEVFSLLRPFHLPRALYQHLSFSGSFRVRFGEASFRMIHHGTQIENELYWRGVLGWEPVSMRVWIELSKRAEIIFDIGANTGLYSLVAKAANPHARVFGFEPLARIHEKFRANCALNGFEIVCERRAASDIDGTRILYDRDVPHPTSVSLSADLPGTTKTVPTPVEVVTLSSYVREQGLPRVDLIKLDVELHEPEVVRGMGGLLNLSPPSMIVEVVADTVAVELEWLVKDVGYLKFYLCNASGAVVPVKELRAHHHLDTNFLLCTEPVARGLGVV
jgi:FkbM family methyltransferase